jgi:hypothetical protein
MYIMASDLKFYYTGGASNSDPDASLGGVGSSVQIVDPAVNNLFDNVEPTETALGDYIDYRGIDLRNVGDALAGAIEFFFTDTPNPESVLAVWYDSVGTQTIVDEDTEPSGAAGNWTEPTLASKLSLPDLTNGSSHRLWIRRTVSQSASNIPADTATLHCWFA